MEAENIHPLKSLIKESKKIRTDRGEDFFTNKKEAIEVRTQIQTPSSESVITKERELKNIRDSHFKLSSLIADNEKKIFDKTSPVFTTKKTRSKSIHLYVDDKIEHFLKTESEKAHTKWGLRKNAGLGNLIQKFILNFIELKKREERQLKRIHKVINEFQLHLVDFKKYSGIDLISAEESNKSLKTLSNDLNILIAILEFEEGALKNCIGEDNYRWVEFICKWMHFS